MKTQCLWRIIVAACLLLLAPGCIEIIQTIQLNEDGSGTFTEVVRFDDRLVQAGRSSPELAGLMDFLKEDAVKARLEEYGEATLVSHEVKDLGAKGKEAVTVLAFKHIDNFTVPALPNRGTNWPAQKFKFKLRDPITMHEPWRNAYYLRRPVAISLSPKTADAGGRENAVPPEEKEKLQTLLPVMRSMLEGFSATLKLEAFGPVEGASKTHTIYSVKAEQISDDDTLMKVIQFNSFPDKFLGANGVVGSGGVVRNEDYVVYIALPYTTEPTTAPIRYRHD